MSVFGLGAFFKRFTVKFVEVVGAGIATAVSGYLLAHFTGYWSPRTGAPAAVQVAPNAGAPNATVATKSPRAQPKQPVVLDVGEQRLANAPEPEPATKPQPHSAAIAAPPPQPPQPPQPAPVRKHPTTETSAAESKPHDTQRDMESVEAQVRAALANVDASRPAPPELPPHQADIAPAPPAPVTPSRLVEPSPHQLDNPAPQPAALARPHQAEPSPPQPAVQAPRPADGIAAVAPANNAETKPTPAAAAPVELAPLPQPQPVQQPPAPSEPLPTVEIRSRPVAAIDSSASAAPENKTGGDDKGLFSVFKKIPDMLRSDTPAADGNAPRPPLPVGQ
jgi:hypothetical protein